MKKKGIGLLTTLAAIVLLLLVTAAGFAKPDAKGQGFVSTDELECCLMAGIASAKLPEENAEVLFETILGVDLAGYRAAENVDGLLYELKSGRADVICCPDVMAEYLLRTEEGLKRLEAPADTSNSVEDGGRLAFGMVLPEGNEALQEELDKAIYVLHQDGTLKAMTVAYIDADEPLSLYRTTTASGKKTLYVGVTGTLPPIDRFDENGVPCGFSVAFLEAVEKRTGYHFQLVPIGNEDAFALLNSGKVDLLFAYGTGRNTTPGKKNYLMTKGYYTMQEYAYLTLE